MKHNLFQLTIKLNYYHTDYEKAADEIDQFLYHTAENLQNQQAEILDQLVFTYEEGFGLVYSSLEAKDYGVPQIGISIVHNYLKTLYLSVDDQLMLITKIMIHPHSLGKGAVVNWNDFKKELIITELDQLDL